MSRQQEMEDRVLALAANLDPNDHSLEAEQLRENAASIVEHRRMAALRQQWP